MLVGWSLVPFEEMANGRCLWAPEARAAAAPCEMMIAAVSVWQRMLAKRAWPTQQATRTVQKELM